MLRMDDDVDKEQRYFSFGALQDSVKRTSRTPFTRVANLGLGTKTLPEAQRTQGIASLTCVISPANGGETCINSRFGHQMAPFALVANLATRWRHLHKSTSLALPHCLELPSWHYQLVLTWYLHQPESHQLSLTKR